MILPLFSKLISLPLLHPSPPGLSAYMLLLSLNHSRELLAIVKPTLKHL